MDVAGRLSVRPADMKAMLLQNVGRVMQRRRIRSLRANGSTAKGRPLVVGLLSTPSGLGSGARLVFNGLEQAGYEPSFLDVTPYFSGHAASINLPESRPDDGTGPVILHINPIELAHLLDIGVIPTLKDRYRVGMWAWEQTTLPKKWRAMTPWVDELWGSSRFLANLFKSQTNSPSHYVRYPCGLFNASVNDPDLPASGLRVPHSDIRREAVPYKILIAFSSLSSMERKNPKGAVDAFLKAFPDRPDVALTIQAPSKLTATEYAQLHCDSRITVIDQPLKDSEIMALFRSHDAFLSLHRAEGFGLSIAKSLALGVPAIFTDHSGSADFTASPLAFGVRSHPVAVQSGNPHYRRRYGRWANPDVEQAAEILQRLRNIPAEKRAALSREAVDWWQTHYGADDLVRRIAMTPFSARLNPPLP